MQDHTFPACQCGTLEPVPHSLKINKSVSDQLSHVNQVTGDSENKWCGTLPGLTREGITLLPLAEARFISRVSAAFPELALLDAPGMCLAQPQVTAQAILSSNKNRCWLGTET